MITIRTQPWNNEATGKNHTLTKYQVGKTADFTLGSNILQEVDGDSNNKMLNIGRINLLMPEGTVWYTRFKRFFSDGTFEANFSVPEAAYSKDVNNNKFIKSTSVIEKPSIKVEDKEAFLEITSSTAKIDGADGHLYTSYFLFSSGVLVYRKVEDEDNLTSLVIPVTELNFKILDELTVHVVYGTTNGAESPMATFKLNTSKLGYSISGDFGNIPYNKNQIYTLTSPDNNVIVANAFLYNGSGESLGEFHRLVYINKEVGLVKTSEIYVESEHFMPNSIYTLRLHLVNSSNEAISEIKNYVITTEELDAPFVVDEKFVYSNLDFKMFTGLNGTLPVGNIFAVSYESNYKDIFLPSTSLQYSLSKFKLYPNNLELALDKDIDMAISNTVAPKAAFFTRDKRLLVLVAIDASTLRLVEFNYNAHDSIVLSKISTTNFAIPNAIAMIEKNAIELSDNEKQIYYITNSATTASVFGRINIATKAIETLASRPANDSQANLVNVGGNRFFSSKGNLNFNSFYVYDADTNTWSTYTATYPASANYFNCSIGILRKDGKILFIANKNSSGKYLVTLDIKEKIYSEQVLDSIPSNMVVNSIVRQTNGAFIIVLKNEFNNTEKGILYYS